MLTPVTFAIQPYPSIGFKITIVFIIFKRSTPLHLTYTVTQGKEANALQVQEENMQA